MEAVPEVSADLAALVAVVLVAVVQVDSSLVEFGRIHPDKTTFGFPYGSTHLYSYIFTDWLQMHTWGGSAINPRFRYTIYSYKGDSKAARVSQLAERVVTPMVATTIALGRPSRRGSGAAASGSPWSSRSAPGSSRRNYWR